MVNKSSPFQTSFFYLMFRNLKKFREILIRKKNLEIFIRKKFGKFWYILFQSISSFLSKNSLKIFFATFYFFIFLYKFQLTILSDLPIRGTLFDVFKKKFSKSLNVCDRRPKRGTFFVTFRKNPGVSVLIVLLLLHWP